MVKSVVLACGVWCALVASGCSPARSVVSIGDDGLSDPPAVMEGIYEIGDDFRRQIIVLKATGKGSMSAILYNEMNDTLEDQNAEVPSNSPELDAYLESIDATPKETVIFRDQEGQEIVFIGDMRYDIKLLQEGDRTIGEISYFWEVSDEITGKFEQYLITNFFYYIIFEPMANGDLRAHLLETDDLEKTEYENQKGTILLHRDALRSTLHRVAKSLDMTEDAVLERSSLTFVREAETPPHE